MLHNIQMASKKQSKGKVLVVLGPTASGKSSAAIALAKRFNGEVISADSRQVYRGMNLGTGKVEGEMGKIDGHPAFFSEDVPHYMIDIVSPLTDYNVAKFKREVYKLIPWIQARGKLPILCGGTMFWITTVVENLDFPGVLPDRALRRELYKLSERELFDQLKKADPDRAKTIDAKNKVRLVRALEISARNQRVGELKTGPQEFDFLQVGLNWPKEVLHERIAKRLNERFDHGMVEEVEKLRKSGVTWKRMDDFGLEYRYISRYLRGKLELKEMKQLLFIAIRQYAKRQMTWFKRPAKRGSIVWENNLTEIEQLVKSWIHDK